MLYETRYKISFSVPILINFLLFSLLGIISILMAFQQMVNGFAAVFVLLMVLGFFMLVAGILYIFPRCVIIKEDRLIVYYGINFLGKQYDLHLIENLRFANNSDIIVRNQPTNGCQNETLAIRFQKGEMLFLSIDHYQEFYQEICCRCEHLVGKNR